MTFAEAGADAEATLLHIFYAGNGLWRDCNLRDCHAENRDWGVDAATYTLYLRWKTTQDPIVATLTAALVSTTTEYPTGCRAVPCRFWSDIPEWDAIALMREYEVLGGDKNALARARAAFDYVDRASVFALGACPNVHYQRALGGGINLKTLETDGNATKAALLLYNATHERQYLKYAVARYATVRRYFLDSVVPLYSVWLFDNGQRCDQVPHRFYASVNGDMIWNGLALARATGNQRYRDEAIATGKAVDRYLSDGRGVFADLQAENDIVEPLVESMYDLAIIQHQDFARDWILRNAAAALTDREPDGTFGRFFDGPPPKSKTVSVWQSNGGLALEIAAAALAPNAVPQIDTWDNARFVPTHIDTLPATIEFDGSAIAIVGTMGDECCELGHARIYIDGVETFDHTGIWQNKSMSGAVPDSVLFAWRWPTSGHHTIAFEPGIPNAKEGGPFISLDGYYVK